MPDSDYLWPQKRHYGAIHENQQRVNAYCMEIDEIKRGIENKRELLQDLEQARNKLIQSHVGSKTNGEYVNSLQWYQDMIEEMIGAIRLAEIRINELEGGFRVSRLPLKLNSQPDE